MSKTSIPKQPPTAKGFLAKPKNYIKPVKAVRPEPSVQLPKGKKP